VPGRAAKEAPPKSTGGDSRPFSLRGGWPASADAVQPFVANRADPPCLAVARRRARWVRVVGAGRPGLAPAGGRLGALVLNDLGDLEQEVERIKGAADERAAAGAVRLEYAEHQSVEPVRLGGLKTEPWDRIVSVDVSQHGAGRLSEPPGNIEPVRTVHDPQRT